MVEKIVKYAELLKEEFQKKKALIGICFQKVNYNVGIEKVVVGGYCVGPLLIRADSRLDKKVKLEALGANEPYTIDVIKTT